MWQIKTNWRARPACAGMDSRIFFPERENKEFSPTEAYERAREVCNVCPIKDQCLEVAIKNGETSGMWGGKTPRERGVKGVLPPDAAGIPCGVCGNDFTPNRPSQRFCRARCTDMAYRRRIREQRKGLVSLALTPSA